MPDKAPFIPSGPVTTNVDAPNPFPANPSAGDEVVYRPDPATRPTTAWKFRRVGAKWLFVGGAPVVAKNDGNALDLGAGFTVVGASFAVPLAAEYVASFSSNGAIDAATHTTVLALFVNGAQIIDSAAAANAGWGQVFGRTDVPFTANAGHLVELRGRADSGTSDIFAPVLSILPVALL